MSRVIKKVLVPAMKKRGFAIKEGLEETATWAQGRDFVRTCEGREEFVRTGADKFGGRLGLNIGRQRKDGSYAYMPWDKHGLVPDQLRYTDDKSLTEVLEFLIFFFDGQVQPWLDSVD